ncbi:MAG: hypothetical protein KDC38_14465, partial [Planctomycetes bacterium]|nr:hypothetical protein [Planctomycetota bacterium]
MIAGGSLLATGCVGVEPAARESPSDAPPRSFDFTDHSAALEADRTVKSACQFCNSLCGLTVSLKSGRIVAITGEKDD